MYYSKYYRDKSDVTVWYSKTHVKCQVISVHEILEEVQMKKFLSTRLGPSKAFGNSI